MTKNLRPLHDVQKHYLNTCHPLDEIGTDLVPKYILLQSMDTNMYSGIDQLTDFVTENADCRQICSHSFVHAVVCIGGGPVTILSDNGI